MEKYVSDGTLATNKTHTKKRMKQINKQKKNEEKPIEMMMIVLCYF